MAILCCSTCGHESLHLLTAGRGLKQDVITTYTVAVSKSRYETVMATRVLVT